MADTDPNVGRNLGSRRRRRKGPDIAGLRRRTKPKLPGIVKDDRNMKRRSTPTLDGKPQRTRPATTPGLAGPLGVKPRPKTPSGSIPAAPQRVKPIGPGVPFSTRPGLAGPLGVPKAAGPSLAGPLGAMTKKVQKAKTTPRKVRR